MAWRRLEPVGDSDGGAGCVSGVVEEEPGRRSGDFIGLSRTAHGDGCGGGDIDYGATAGLAQRCDGVLDAGDDGQQVYVEVLAD